MQPDHPSSPPAPPTTTPTESTPATRPALQELTATPIAAGGAPPAARSWSTVQHRSRTLAIAAGVVAFAVIGSIIYYLAFYARVPMAPTKSSTVSVELPSDQLQKLSGQSLQVATDRTLSFNTPVAVRQSLDVKGDTTLSNVKITGSLTYPGQSASTGSSQNLTVAGTSLLQGDVTAKGKLTVGSSLNVGGSGSFGGNLSATSLSVKSASLGNATITRLITAGLAPTIAGATALGGGSVAISGNDTAGTITVTTGAGATAQGDLATVTFRSAYGSTPHVSLTPTGIGTALALSGGMLYASRSTAHFTVGATHMQIGVAGVSYTFDYFVSQ
jgi:hypothetical protein